MFDHICRAISTGIVFTLILTFLGGCGGSDHQVTTRMHLTNVSGSTVVFLAIEDSELAVKMAPNRLAQPLPPSAVYSAVLPRTGNYWVRTETQSEGSTLQRIVGPIRIGRGIQDWEFTRDDEMPLYLAPLGGKSLAVSLPSAQSW